MEQGFATSKSLSTVKLLLDVAYLRLEAFTILRLDLLAMGAVGFNFFFFSDLNEEFCCSTVWYYHWLY